MTSIPASAIVSVQPSVIDAGGDGLDIIGLMLSDSSRLPVGSVLAFSSAADVTAYFGSLTTESLLATVYFAGFDDSSVKPGSLLFARYATTAAAGFLRGGTLGLTLAQLQALSGVLTITVGGTAFTSSTINFAGSSSFSNAAAIIQAAFTSPTFTVSYDSVSGAFVATSNATGATATMTYASGSLAASLLLTQTTGAVLSQGAAEMVPGTAMDAVVAISQDFVSFMTTFDPDATTSGGTNDGTRKLAFGAWVDGQNSRYLYAPWTADTAARATGDTSSFLAQIKTAGYGSVAGIYDPNNGASVAAFTMGSIASMDFTEANGRATLAFKTGSVSAGVTNQTIAANLITNGYNYVGAYATANDAFTFLYPGQVTGDFDYIDSWVCQVWMNNAFQLALMELLTSVKSIPFNADGATLIKSALQDVIDDALNFGAIRTGVTLSNAQKAEVKAAAGGNDIGTTLQNEGYYVYAPIPAASVRATRGPWPVKVFYTDGGSVHSISLNSVLVQ